MTPELVIDRLPPFSEQCEKSVLGALILDPQNGVHGVLGIFGGKGDHFYDLRHQVIFDEILEMDSKQVPVNVISLHQRLKDKNLLEQVGGIAYLNELQDSVPSAANLSYYAEVVKEKWLLRQVRNVCTTILDSVYEQTDDVDGFLDSVERQILAIRPQKLATRQTIKQLVLEATNDIERRFEKEGAIAGLSTGLLDLDRHTDGMRPGNLIVPAAYPSVGKTSLLMNIVEHVVLVEKRSAAVFTLEMSAKELVERFISSNSQVNLRGRLYENDFPKLIAAAGRIADSTLHIIDDCTTVEEIRSEARRLKQQHNIELVGVDYIQRVHTRNARRDANREQEISYIGNTLKSMAKDLGIPCIAPSQLNDDGKLRESRAIGQDADQVWMLERDDKASTYETDSVKLRVAKNRGGPRGGVIDLNFYKQYTKFKLASRISDDDIPSTRTQSYPRE